MGETNARRRARQRGEAAASSVEARHKSQEAARGLSQLTGSQGGAGAVLAFNGSIAASLN
jgi:hypothetical protein